MTGQGSELRELRKAARLALWDVAKRVGLTANDLSLLELERKPLSPERFAELKSAIQAEARERARAVGAA